MKILFWILAIVSIPFGLFMSVVSWAAEGLDLAGTQLGEVLTVAGMFSAIVSIVCVVPGIIMLRRKKVKKAVIFALAAVVYPAVILGGIFLDEALHTAQLEKDLADYYEQTYGENWDAPPAIEGIPELYQEMLNKFYVVVRDEWSSDQMTDMSTTEMEKYYGDASLDNIGFILMDVNADGCDELIIGTTAPVEEGGTAIFCMYSDPENPHDTLNGVQGELYYLHSVEGGAYVAEIGGSYMPEVGDTKGAWLLHAYSEGEKFVGIDHYEEALDPAGRLTLELIPFAQYK
jgi:hypothetical protein